MKRRNVVKKMAVLLCSGVCMTVGCFSVSADTYLNYGYPKSNNPPTQIGIQPYSYNATWQPAMNDALDKWGIPAKNSGVKFCKNSSASNTVTAEYLYTTWYGLNQSYFNGNTLISFDIQLNSRKISSDSTNVSNFIKSVFVHELGHSIWLADNPGGTSIMNYSRDRNTMVNPSSTDYSRVRSKYN